MVFKCKLKLILFKLKRLRADLNEHGFVSKIKNKKKILTEFLM